LRLDRLGETALILTWDGDASIETQRRIWSVAAAARAWSGVGDVVPGMNNLTLFVDLPSRVPEVETRLRDSWPKSTDEPVPVNVVEIPVRYGDAYGPDLPEVARACRRSEEEVVALHCEREYEVYFLGFQPGFAYLGDLHEQLRLPRREWPRAGVPAGSVAIAERMTGVYPARAPGGWHLIGRTPLQLFDVERDPPSLLLPGDRVRFVTVS
jgi:5-oxoprolinase (ATP-hydrolysing) subunit B